MKWRKQRNKPVSSVHPLNQMSEGYSQGSLNWPLNTGLTGLKAKSRKDDGREKCPLQDDPHPPKSAFYLSLFLRKRTYRPFNSIHINKKQEEIK